MNKRRQALAKKMEAIARDLNQEAAFAYTASSQRQILMAAALLLREYKTEDEILPHLAAIIDGIFNELLPRNAVKIITMSKALQRIKRQR